jgi:hypothetical protein
MQQYFAHCIHRRRKLPYTLRSPPLHLILKAVWRVAMDRYGAPKEQMHSLVATHESLRYQGQGERHGMQPIHLLFI